MSKEKLRYIRSSWHRLVITISLVCLLFTASCRSRRAHLHWLGRYRRRRRFERHVIIVLILSAMPFLEPYEYVYWSILWGGGMAIFLNLYTIYQLIPRKRGTG